MAGLVCAICGHREIKNLKNHLQEVHKLTTTEYKKQYPGKKTMTGHSKRTVDYWIYQGYTEEQAVNKVKEFQKTMYELNKKALKEQGLSEEDVKDFQSKRARRVSKRCIEFYLDRGMSHQEAESELSKFQAKWSGMSQKFKGKRHTKASKDMIAKKSLERAAKIGGFAMASRFNKGRKGPASGGEISCYMRLKEIIPSLKSNVDVEGKLVDMIYDRTIIEYHGDFWHRNPNKYEDTYEMYGKVSKDVWKKDDDRKLFLESKGYVYVVIWEADWKSNQEEVLIKIKQLYESRNSSRD